MMSPPSSPTESTRPQRTFVGLDLGEPVASSTLAVLQRAGVATDDPPALRRPVYAVQHLQRWPPEIPPSDLAEALRNRLATPGLADFFLVTNRTHVGAAVTGWLYDQLRSRTNGQAITVTILANLATAATAPWGGGMAWQELIGTLRVLPQTRRLQIAAKLPVAATLRTELTAFTRRPASPNPAAPLRERPQDDPVFAVALASWAGKHALPPLI